VSVFKKYLKKYSDILDKVEHSIDTITFETVEEKDLLINVLKDKIADLKEKDEYLDGWHEIIERQKLENPDWKDPRL